MLVFKTIGLKYVFAFIVYVGFSLLLVGQEAVLSDQALSERVANYDISVRLDTAKKMLTAKQIIYWKNPSQNTIHEIPFHLYLNAFKNSQSTFIQERGGTMPDMRYDEMDYQYFSWINIDQIKDAQGNDLTSRLKYIQPDDDNVHDRTVIQLDLTKPVGPGESITLVLNWTAKLPRVRMRTGYSRDYFLIAQWFPKVGVYEPPGMRFSKGGKWNCHQYHPSTEYYADFGVYNVDITVPKGFKVGASGYLVKEASDEDTQTFFYRAEDVIDFTWTAYPKFQVIEDKWKDVNIKLYIIPEYGCCDDRYITAAKNGLEYLEKYFMKYPFPNLTIVVPPFHGLNSGAMEYPTFITAPGMYRFPKSIRSPEYFVIHELIHQYFMMMVATNEFEEAWMDEGFTSYYESRILDYYYGDKNSVIDFGSMGMGAMEFRRTRYVNMKNPSVANMTLPGWEYPHGGYRSLIYSKAAVMLRTLEGLVGTDTMDLIMKTYFERWKFKHPCRLDFIDVVNEVVAKMNSPKLGPDMNWFFDQVLYGTGICDYAVEGFYNQRNWTRVKGIYDRDSAKVQHRLVETDGYLKPIVRLNRLGEVQLPVDVKVTFADGKVVWEHWDGKDRAIIYEYVSDQRIVSVEIDPERKIYMDINFLNNGKKRNKEQAGIWKYVSQFMLKFQTAMQSLSFLI